MTRGTRIAVLGASGLIGQAVAEALARSGVEVIAVARAFTPAQAAAFPNRVTCPIVDLETPALTDLLAAHRPDMVLNCLGVLQDGPGRTTRDVHVVAVGRLLQAIAAQGRPMLLVHVSIPGRPGDDETSFSRTKREAEDLIRRSSSPYVILRPGFVIAPGAYGGSALIRSLAMVPFGLPDTILRRPLATTAVDDVASTVAHVADRWTRGERDWHAAWDVVAGEPSTVGSVIGAVRRRFGGPRPALRLPGWTLRLGALAGDAAGMLGWLPPIRTTALRELTRGVEGDPATWIADSGIAPTGLGETVSALPSSVQERWFGRLYLAKPLIIGCLAGFWVLSGSIALFVAFEPATAVFTAHGFPERLARLITAASSLADIAIGIAIAIRRTCRVALRAGIALSLGYMAGAALITPGLWVEPLGALVKTFPAIVLMMVALAILDAR